MKSAPPLAIGQGQTLADERQDFAALLSDTLEDARPAATVGDVAGADKLPTPAVEVTDGQTTAALQGPALPDADTILGTLTRPAQTAPPAALQATAAPDNTLVSKPTPSGNTAQPPGSAAAPAPEPPVHETTERVRTRTPQEVEAAAASAQDALATTAAVSARALAGEPAAATRTARQPGLPAGAVPATALPAHMSEASARARSAPAAPGTAASAGLPGMEADHLADTQPVPDARPGLATAQVSTRPLVSAAAAATTDPGLAEIPASAATITAPAMGAGGTAATAPRAPELPAGNRAATAVRSSTATTGMPDPAPDNMGLNPETAVPSAATDPVRELAATQAPLRPQRQAMLLAAEPSTALEAARGGAEPPDLDAAGFNLAERLASETTLLSGKSAAEAWLKEIGLSMGGVVQGKLGRMTLQLHPAELGALEIDILTQDGVASVDFAAVQPATRDLLEASLPRLRELLQQQGLLLGEAVVRDHTRQQQSGQDRNSDKALRVPAAGKEPDGNDSDLTPRRPRIDHAALLDAYV